MPTLNIKDPAVHRLAAELAARRGTSMTGAVRQALQETLQREPPRPRATVEEILAIARLARESSDEPFLTDDDLYDDSGLPR